MRSLQKLSPSRRLHRESKWVRSLCAPDVLFPSHRKRESERFCRIGPTTPCSFSWLFEPKRSTAVRVINASLATSIFALTTI
ncbi:hypothetical protein PYCCODRAFT_367048 [Trametes coccinea BRFM310]|uniref:Uncharacterized protein n=1 Tax=Trametes coccinea (strain BRFM310) TaxID=1353009 RepID=A0A1Y2J3H1_TRAC3|nr:hypothetical protein PYCCODRAFT_367048 [Trametes coccinea BRFM310]